MKRSEQRQARRPTQRARKAAQRMEGQLEGDGRKKYTLKNGRKIEGGRAIGILRCLESLLEQNPELFGALFAIVQGRPEGATPEAVAMLKDGGYLRTDTGAVCADIPDVLNCAYQQTPEGPVLVNPFRFEGPHEVREIERRERQRLDRLLGELRKREDKGPPPPTRG